MSEFDDEPLMPFFDEDEPRESEPFSATLQAIFDREHVAIAALYHLSDIEDEPYHEFLDRWEAAPLERRRAISRHLADIMENNFQVDFVRVFRYCCLADEDADVRIAGLDGLWDSTNVGLVRPIIALMQNDPSEKVRAAAAATLSHYVLMAEWGQVSGSVKTPIVQALLVEWDSSDSLAVRRAALEALGAADDPRVPEVIESGYRSGQFDLQRSAVFAMGNSADARWLPSVIAEMSSPYEEMRAEAARAAGSIGRSGALDALQELLFDDDDDVQLAAIAALGEIGSDRAREALTDLRREVLDDERFLEAIDEALEEMDWLSGGIDLTFFDFDDDDAAEESDWAADGPVA